MVCKKYFYTSFILVIHLTFFNMRYIRHLVPKVGEGPPPRRHEAVARHINFNFSVLFIRATVIVK